MSAAGAMKQDDFAAYEMASPSLLADQPPSLPFKSSEPSEDWDQIYAHLESRLGALRNWRWSWWCYWSVLAEFLLPRRWHWTISSNIFNKGNPINQAIIDGTATLAKNICAAGMIEGLMPTTREWFKMRTALENMEPDAAAKEWLEDTEQRAYTVLAQSNFYTEMAQVAEDEVVFGTSPPIMYEDAEKVIRLYVPCAGEYFLAVGSTFTVDTLYREYVMTVAQIVEFFTLESCPQQVRELWEAAGGSIDNEFVVAHAIEPNFALQGRGRSSGKISVVPQSFTFREVYWLRSVKTDRPLSKRGFHTKPFAAFRWSKTSNDPYGRSPGMDALGDTQQLQTETKRKAEAIEKTVRPPMGADVSMKNEPSSIRPGDITYVNATDGKKGFWPLFEMKFDLSAMMADLKEVQTRIEKYFMVDVFMAISQMEGVQPRNNLEIAERKGEKMQRLGPVIGLWKNEAATLLARLIDIMSRRKMLKPLPPSLRGVPLKFEFLDMVTLAQLGQETAAMEQCFKIGGELSLAAQQAQLPNPLRVINMDDSYRVYLDRMSYPIKGVFTAQEVAQHDQARAQAQQQAQQPAQMQAMVDGASSLSKIDLGGGQNPISALLGKQGGAPAPGSGM